MFAGAWTDARALRLLTSWTTFWNDVYRVLGPVPNGTTQMRTGSRVL